MPRNDRRTRRPSRNARRRQAVHRDIANEITAARQELERARRRRAARQQNIVIGVGPRRCRCGAHQVEPVGEDRGGRLMWAVRHEHDCPLHHEAAA